MVHFNHSKVRSRSRFSFLFLSLLVAPDLKCSKGESIYVSAQKDNRKLQSLSTFGSYKIEWDIDLGGKESLLDSPSLEAGFEQIIKDYMNDDVQCNNELSLGNASFFSFNLVHKGDGKISGSAICEGHSERCKWETNQTISDANTGNMTTNSNESDEFCETFRNSTIFDYFKKTIATGASFNYDADVNVNDINLEGTLDLSYNVTFKPAEANGLDMIEIILFNPKEAVEISPTDCTEAQCIMQRSTMLHIFREVGLSVYQDKPVCLYHGINCNEDGLVTQVWLGRYHMYANILFFNVKRWSLMECLTIPYNLLQLTTISAIRRFQKSLVLCHH